jgi:hypothetical protein
MEELETLPQIVSAYSQTSLQRCRELFAALTTDVIELTPLEAELAKLSQTLGATHSSPQQINSTCWRTITARTSTGFTMR